MSDIPIGSPPVPPGRHAAPSGWYADPVDAAQERYWDGWQWSRNTRPNERGRGPTPRAPSPPPYGQPPQPAGQQPYPPSFPPQPYGPPQQPYGQPQQPYPAPYRPGAQPPLLTADGVPVSGWWWRALAIIIDGLIVGVIAALLSSPIYVRLFNGFADYFNEVIAAAEAGLPAPPQPSPTALIPVADQVSLGLIALAVEAAYLLIFLRWRSATPGKLVCGLRVVPVDQGRFPGPLAWRTIVIRMAVWVLPALPFLGVYLLIFRVLDVLFPLWQPKRQAIHDLAAGTQVVKIDSYLARRRDDPAAHLAQTQPPVAVRALPRMITSSPSSKKVRSPPASRSGRVPFQLSSSRDPC